MKTLLPSGFKGSIKAAVESRHCQKSTWKEQISEDDTILREEISWHVACRKAYQQLWLFSLRHFPEMTGCSPRKDPGRPKPRTPAIESSWWSRLAALAADCGFVGLSGPSANGDSADAKMARDFLRQARPDLLYEFDVGSFDTEVQRICESLARCKKRKLGPENPKISTDRDVCGTDIAYRCGRPFESSFLDDQQFLFLGHMKGRVDDRQRRYITSFAVSRGMFKNFFEPADEITSYVYGNPLHLSVSTNDRLDDLDSVSHYPSDSASTPSTVRISLPDIRTEPSPPDTPGKDLTMLQWSPGHPEEFAPRSFHWCDWREIQSSTDGFYLLNNDLKYVSPIDVVARRAGNRFIQTKGNNVAQLKEFYEKRSGQKFAQT